MQDFQRFYVTPLDVYLETGYGLYVVRATKNDVILEFFNDVIAAYTWLQQRLTDEQLDDLVDEMKASLLEFDFANRRPNDIN